MVFVGPAGNGVVGIDLLVMLCHLSRQGLSGESHIFFGDGMKGACVWQEVFLYGQPRVGWRGDFRGPSIRLFVRSSRGRGCGERLHK